MIITANFDLGLDYQEALDNNVIVLIYPQFVLYTAY